MEISVAIDNAINAIKASGGRVMAQFVGGSGNVGGMSLIAMVRNRVEQKGINYKNIKFVGYSTKPTLTGWPSSGLQQNYSKMYKTVYQNLAKRKTTKWRTVNGHKLMEVPGGYKEMREIGGYQTDHVDFNISGALWKSIKVLRYGIEGNKIFATYGASDSENQKKLAGLEKKRPDILMPSDKELQIMANGIKTWLIEQIENELKK